MATFGNNFNTVEVRNLAATTASSRITFSTNDAINNCADAMIVNQGPNAAWILAGNASVVALNAAGNNGTKNTLVLPGNSIIIGVGTNPCVAAICDAGTAQLAIHAGRGQ
jgi:hypothetical protein